MAMAMAKRNARLYGALLLATIVAITAIAVGSATAHQAPSGWHYPPGCCSGNDCAPVDRMELQADGSLRVTTKHGTSTFPADFPRKDSPDGQAHACFTPLAQYCLFLGPGT